MEDIIRLILDRQLRDFQGTEIKGQIAIGDELVNELLAQLLAAAATPAPPAAEKKKTGKKAAPDQTATPAPLDPRQLLSWITVRQLEYRTEAGRTVLDLDIGV